MIHINLQWICSCLLFNLVVLLQSVRPCFGFDDPNYTACVPKSCGGAAAGINVSYPFWIKDHQDSSCGFPGFDVSCNTKNETIIRLFGSNYTIKDIYNNNQTIRVIDSDFVNFSSRNTCSIPFHNLTLFGDRFEFALNHTKLYILSSCASLIWGVLEAHKVNGCFGWNESDPVFAILENEFLNVTRNIAGKCEKVVEVPVELAGDEVKNGKLGGENLEEVFERGLMLKWIATECVVCTDSGGRCGFDVKQYQFTCFCTDRPQFNKCSPGPSFTRIRRILGFAVAFAAIMVVSIVGSMMCCCFRKSIRRIFTRKSGHDNGFE